MANSVAICRWSSNRQQDVHLANLLDGAECTCCVRAGDRSGKFQHLPQWFLHQRDGAKWQAFQEPLKSFETRKSYVMPCSDQPQPQCSIWLHVPSGTIGNDRDSHDRFDFMSCS